MVMVNSEVSEDGQQTTISIKGRFDYSLHADFRKQYRENSAKNMSFIIDLSNTDYIDSSALGMLLLLREAAGGSQANIKIVNCKSEVRNILKISNFQNLFVIE